MSSMKLYVGNLSFQTSESDLEELFTPFGKVLSAKIITDRMSGQPRGFGFVEMADRSEGEKAIAALEGKEVKGRKLTVNEAKPRPEGSRGGFGGGGGGGRGRGRERY